MIFLFNSFSPRYPIGEEIERERGGREEEEEDDDDDDDEKKYTDSCVNKMLKAWRPFCLLLISQKNHKKSIKLMDLIELKLITHLLLK